MRRYRFWCTCVCLVLILSGCIFDNQNDSEDKIGKTSENESKELFTIYGLHNGDAKFYGDKIITNTAKGFVFYDFKGNEVKIHSSIKANWIDCLEDEGIVILCNANNETRICRFDKAYNLIENQIIFETKSLAIDPSILKVGQEYYITITTIEGTVNNDNVNNKNGIYTVELYRSTDLKHWEFVNTILKETNNIEDVEIKLIDNHLALVYEKEQIDKGLSSVNLIISSDNIGEEWNNKVELLVADSDHEPAAFYMLDDRYVLYYSTDKERLGESYNGAKVYYTTYDSNFNRLEENIDLKLENRIGNLLYDSIVIDNKRYLLFAQDYLTNCNLVVEYQEEY